MTAATAPTPYADAEDAAFEARMKAREAEIRRACAEARKLDDRERLLRHAEMLADAIGEDPLTGQRFYTTEDVLSWIEHTLDMGCAMPRIGPKTIIDALRIRIVPTARLRERFLRMQADGKVSAKDAAKRVGMTRLHDGRIEGDSTRFRRALGITPSPSSTGRPPTLRMFISYEDAVTIADALDIPYHEVGV